MCYQPLHLKDNIIAPCGVCPRCVQNTRVEWMARNLIHSKYFKNRYFVTLTYDQDSIKLLPFDEETMLYLREKSHYQNWLKRLRKIYNISYYGVHEYGDRTKRPHYHFIIYTDDEINDFDKYWSYGFTSTYQAKISAIHYVSGYVQKPFRYFRNKDEYLRAIYKNNPIKLFESLRNLRIFENTKKMMSLKPAIGSQLLDNADIVKYIRDYSLEYSVYPPLAIDGKTYKLPRYYIKKIFTDDERKRIYDDYLSNYNESLIEKAKLNNLSVPEYIRNRQQVGYIRFTKMLKNRQNENF